MSQNVEGNSELLNELDWIRIRTEYHTADETESFIQRIVRKSKENPLVPIGASATVAALSYGIWSFYKGNSLMSQYMMRARVGAQAFTIIALVGGSILAAEKRA